MTILHNVLTFDYDQIYALRQGDSCWFYNLMLIFCAQKYSSLPVEYAWLGTVCPLRNFVMKIILR